MKSLFVMGIVFFIGSIILIISNYEKFNIERNGRIVKMKIESLPKYCIGSKIRYFVTYSYGGKMYDKATRGDFCEKHHLGELIDMKVLEGHQYILKPDESALMNLISMAILGVFGLILSITRWKKLQDKK